MNQKEDTHREHQNQRADEQAGVEMEIKDEGIGRLTVRSPLIVHACPGGVDSMDPERERVPFLQPAIHTPILISTGSERRLWPGRPNRLKSLHSCQKIAAVQDVIELQPHLAASEMSYELFEGFIGILCRDPNCPQVSGMPESCE